jgi:NADH-quinone oxidoreductase subunit L
MFAFILGILAAILTAIYSLKIIMVTFHGKTSLSEDVFNHVHESPKIMNTPLLVLVAGALFSGMLGYYILSIDSPVGYFSGSIFNLDISPNEHHVSLLIQLLPLIIGITGSIIGIYCYRGNTYQKISNKFHLINCVLKNKYFFDELYDQTFVRFTKVLSSLAGCFDIKIIDRFGPNGFAHLTRGISWCICRLQTGYIVNYVLYIVFALVLCITIFVFRYLPVAWSV